MKNEKRKAVKTEPGLQRTPTGALVLLDQRDISLKQILFLFLNTSKQTLINFLNALPHPFIVSFITDFFP
jgi:hypothetical protein